MGFWKNPFSGSSSQSQPSAEQTSTPLSTSTTAAAPPPPATTAEASKAPLNPPSPALAPAPAPQQASPFVNKRLSTPFEFRVILSSSVAVFSGLALGMAHGGQAAALRYRAENAHRLPTDATGWYLYHKSKNYHAMLGGVREGLRMGAKLGLWVGGFFVCEESIDRARGLRGTRGDCVSTVIAGLGTAGAWSLWNRFPPVTIARTAKMGLKVGLAYGLLQDAITLLKGQRLGYVEYLRSIPKRVERRRQRKMNEALARRGGNGGDAAQQHT